MNPTNEKIRAILDQDEDTIYMFYLDPKGKLTVGRGHLVVIGDPVSHETVEWFWQRDLKFAESKTFMYMQTNNLQLNEARYVAVVCLFFNMGSLKKFPNFTKYLSEKEWTKAALELLYVDGQDPEKGKSGYYTDTKSRAERMAKVIETGSLEGYGV
jgi:GH24 family phage-related lysozyme (muramidase)